MIRQKNHGQRGRTGIWLLGASTGRAKRTACGVRTASGSAGTRLCRTAGHTPHPGTAKAKHVCDQEEAPVSVCPWSRDRGFREGVLWAAREHGQYAPRTASSNNEYAAWPMRYPFGCLTLTSNAAYNKGGAPPQPRPIDGKWSFEASHRKRKSGLY